MGTYCIMMPRGPDGMCFDAVREGSSLWFPLVEES